MMRTPPTSATMLKSLATRPRRWAPSTSPCCRLFRDWGEGEGCGTVGPGQEMAAQQGSGERVVPRRQAGPMDSGSRGKEGWRGKGGRAQVSKAA